jgi:hypothetical protein
MIEEISIIKYNICIYIYIYTKFHHIHEIHDIKFLIEIEII